MGVAYLVFLFIILIELYYGLNWSRHKVIFFVITLALAFGLFWEGWEIFSDRYFGSKFFWNLQDGIGDTLANAIGALIVAWDTNHYLLTRSYEDLANDFLILDGKGWYRIRFDALPINTNSRPQNESDGSSEDGLRRKRSVGTSK